MKKVLLIIITLNCITYLKSQVKIGNNPATINANSLLEMESTNKGLLFPRMNTTQMNGIGNIQGMTVFNTDSNCLCANSGSAWVNLCKNSIYVVDTMANAFMHKSGAGTNSSPLLLGLKNGINDGDIIQWDGSKWVSQKYRTQWLDTHNIYGLRSVVSGAIILQLDNILFQ